MKGGEQTDAPDTRTEICLQPVEKTMLNQVPPLQLLENHSRTGGCILKEATARGDPVLWGPSGSVIYREKSMQEQISGRACDPVEAVTLL